MIKAKSVMKPNINEHHDHGSHDKVDNNLLKSSVMPGNNLARYKPLFIILIFCFLIPLFQIRPLDLEEFMYSFMGYFFIYLSLFKLFDLKGFVDGFVTYDIVTKRLRAYGYLYPFIELTLGLGYLAKYDLFLVNLGTVIVMFISGIGVIKSIFSGQKIKCACLGTVLNVPLTTVSVLENFGMGAMAAYKLLYHF